MPCFVTNTRSSHSLVLAATLPRTTLLNPTNKFNFKHVSVMCGTEACKQRGLFISFRKISGCHCKRLNDSQVSSARVSAYNSVTICLHTRTIPRSCTPSALVNGSSCPWPTWNEHKSIQSKNVRLNMFADTVTDPYINEIVCVECRTRKTDRRDLVASVPRGTALLCQGQGPEALGT